MDVGERDHGRAGGVVEVGLVLELLVQRLSRRLVVVARLIRLVVRAVGHLDVAVLGLDLLLRPLARRRRRAGHVEPHLDQLVRLLPPQPLDLLVRLALGVELDRRDLDDDLILGDGRVGDRLERQEEGRVGADLEREIGACGSDGSAMRRRTLDVDLAPVPPAHGDVARLELDRELVLEAIGQALLVLAREAVKLDPLAVLLAELQLEAASDPVVSEPPKHELSATRQSPTPKGSLQQHTHLVH